MSDLAPMNVPNRTASETRILLNGCWDLTHAGHFNALRQVWEIAQRHPRGCVVAGIHSNAEIRRVKGGTFVYTDDEKRVMLEACRFVDAIVCDVPYKQVDETLISSLNCTYAVHGSDAVILKDGTDMYGPVKEAGRYIEIPRSENIATTDLIDRILRGFTEDHSSGFCLSASRVSKFLNSKIDQNKLNFYLQGHFDLFHPGQVEILRRAKKQFPNVNMVVGILSKPTNILTEGERMINLLSCRFVDDVIINISENLTEEFVHAFAISAVIKILNHPDFAENAENFHIPHSVELVSLDCGDIFTNTQEIKNRILSQSPLFIERNNRKLNRL